MDAVDCIATILAVLICIATALFMFVLLFVDLTENGWHITCPW